MSTTTLPANALNEIRTLVESSGFLPMTPKAERLFAVAAQAPNVRDEVKTLREAYDSIGYLSRTKALRLIEIVSMDVAS